METPIELISVIRSRFKSRENDSVQRIHITDEEARVLLRDAERLRLIEDRVQRRKLDSVEEGDRATRQGFDTHARACYAHANWFAELLED